MKPAVLLHHWVRQQAEHAPEAIVLETDSQDFTYGELEQATTCLARALLALGLKPGDRVGIAIPKSFETVVSMLGVMKAGGAYVPLDPLGPPSRAHLIMQSCALRYLITSPALLQGFAEGPGLPAAVEHIILTAARSDQATPVPGDIITWADMQSLRSEGLQEPKRHEDDLAYILYTSGSTGVPKGVMIAHQNARAFIEWACEELHLVPSDRLSNHAPFHFDLSVFDLYATLRSGARMLLISEATARNPRALVQYIATQGPTVWYSVPSALVLMLERGDLAQVTWDALRVLLFAGEVLPVKYLRRLLRAFPRARLYNLYGPTETNVCTFYRVKPEDAWRTAPLPIGRPCSGDQVYVLDEQGRAVQTGEVGELYVEGPTVMLGYWSNSAVLERPQRYGTGDMVHWSTTGELMYHGRKDTMVKVRGFRIELGEVETVLAAHPGLTETAVLPLPDEFDNTYLVAAVVSERRELSVLEIKQHCARFLPTYMIPQVVWFLPTLPKTSTGKLDRVLLRHTWVAQTSSRSRE